MKKGIIIASIATVLVVAFERNTSKALFELFIAGVIPGTHATIPYWVVMVISGALITIFTTLYIWQTAGTIKSTRKATTRKARMPRRRYSHV